ncbi:HNH endonuclease, partial [Nocardiopsis halophila]|uniref:HNH endonuclease n=1 Tax=Nocardiopsis halophila TaxID=141692 RepID=UPI000584DC12
TFPSRVREALVATAGTCQWEEGCSVPARWCQGDHRTEWWEGGATTLGNAQLLCGRHNREKHMRRLQAHYRARASGAGGHRPGGHRDTTRRPEQGPGGDDDDGSLTEAA